MKSLCPCEALKLAFSSSLNHFNSWKPPSFVILSPSTSKRRPCCNSFKFADRIHAHINKENQLSGNIHLPISGEMHDMNYRCIDKSTSLISEENKVECSLIDEISEILKGRRILPYITNKSLSFPKFHVWSVMALLIGILNFQAHQQAIAATEFTRGLQSPSFFEDLGDINTGFASVRKASLELS